VSELHDLTALEQGDAVRLAKASPRELVEHYAGRVDDVGAFVTRTIELALERADALLPVPDDAGPLHGVPTAIKDLNLTAGVRTTFGSAAYADFVPDVSDGVTLSIEHAGMVSLGKTNTPEFGSPCYTEPDVAPPAVTPWAAPGWPEARREGPQPRSPPDSCRWRRARTVGARSASPPRAAGWSG
jgi:amidase